MRRAIIGLHKNNIPLYVQLEQIIRSQIVTGEFVPNGQIPTDKDLAETYRVSIITARQAILNLVNEGLLTRRQGKGTFVVEKPMDIKNIKTLYLRGDVNNIEPEGLGTQKVKILDMMRIKALPNVAKLLGLKEGQEIMRMRRTRSDNEMVISYLRNYLPLEIGEQIRKQDLSKHSLIHVFKEELGIPLSKGIQHIRAISADFDVSAALSIEISSPVLYVETLYFIKKGVPVEFTQAFHRSDVFGYTVNLDMNGKKQFEG
jgi:GntR family transcriptional regulator